MGGKTWSVDEERYFWEVIVPQSQQAVRPSDRVHSWDTLATLMQEAMGEPRRRDYTRTMLYEHYYQNIKTGSHSPKAKQYVRKHKADLKAEAEREQSESVAVSSPPIADSPATPAEVSREPRPQSMHGRATAPLQVGTTPESHARGASLRAALPREASYTVSSPTQLPPLSYTRPPFPRSALSRASLPPPSYPRISPHFETSSTLNGAPHGLKRRTEDVEVDRVSAKRQQLPTLEPAPYHQHQYSMTPSVHIRQASEEWLHQHRPPPKSYATPPPYPRLPSPRVDPRSAMRVESARSGFERLATDIDGAEVAPPGDMSPFDTLVWASRIHSNASENNESNFTPSETTSRSRSASATDTNTPDGSNPENGEAGGRGDGLPSAK